MKMAAKGANAVQLHRSWGQRRAVASEFGSPTGEMPCTGTQRDEHPQARERSHVQSRVCKEAWKTVEANAFECDDFESHKEAETQDSKLGARSHMG